MICRSELQASGIHYILETNYIPGYLNIHKYQEYDKTIEDDTKGVIRSHKSKNDRQYNDKKNEDKTTTNNLQNITQKTKDRRTRTSLKLGGVPEG